MIHLKIVLHRYLQRRVYFIPYGIFSYYFVIINTFPIYVLLYEYSKYYFTLPMFRRLMYKKSRVTNRINYPSGVKFNNKKFEAEAIEETTISKKYIQLSRRFIHYSLIKVLRKQCNFPIHLVHLPRTYQSVPSLQFQRSNDFTSSESFVSSQDCCSGNVYQAKT